MRRALTLGGIALALGLAVAASWPASRAAAQGVLTLVTEKVGNAAPTHALANGARGFNGVLNAERQCDKVAPFVTLGTTATVQQIAAVAGKSIYVCGWLLFASTAVAGVDLTFSEGTGTNCATGTATIGGKFLTTPTAAPTSPNSTFGPTGTALKLTATAGDALCITQSSAANATTLAGMIFYTQN